MMSMRYIETPAVQELIGHPAITSPAEVVHYDHWVVTDSDLMSGSQAIHVSVADVENPSGVIIYPVAHSDYGKRPFQALRLGVVASYAKARVIGLDWPGMGDVEGGRRNELTERQIEQLKDGRVTDLAENYWKVLGDQGELLDDEGNKLPIAFVGNSLSTLTVSEMVCSVPEGHVVTDLMLSESMAISPVHALSKGVNFMKNGPKHFNDYSRLNIGLPDYKKSGLSSYLSQLIIKQPQSHRLAVVALAQGRQLELVESAIVGGMISRDPEHGTLVYNVIAADGLVSESDYLLLNNRLIEFGLSTNGLRRSQRLAGEGHGYQDGLPALLDQIRRLRFMEMQG